MSPQQSPGDQWEVLCVGCMLALEGWTTPLFQSQQSLTPFHQRQTALTLRGWLHCVKSVFLNLD